MFFLAGEITPNSSSRMDDGVFWPSLAIPDPILSTYFCYADTRIGTSSQVHKNKHHSVNICLLYILSTRETWYGGQGFYSACNNNCIFPVHLISCCRGSEIRRDRGEEQVENVAVTTDSPARPSGSITDFQVRPTFFSQTPARKKENFNSL